MSASDREHGTLTGADHDRAGHDRGGLDHDGRGSAAHTGHGALAGHGADASHGGHPGHGKHAGHSVEMFRRRFGWSLLLTIPIVLTSHMVMDWFGYELDFPGIRLVGPVLGTVLFVWGGEPFLKGGAREAEERAPGMMLLIAMAITVAYVASMATSLGALDLDFWWELAALITIMLAGHWQEMKALGQAQDALSALAALLPDEAERLADDGTTQTIPAAALKPGDLVLVRSGARIPADGEITEGGAELDESMITGESRPVAKATGDRVVAGTISTDSSLHVRVTAIGDDTTLAGIGRLVAEAQDSQSRSQVLADRAAALLFYVAMAAALITAIVWTAMGDGDEAVVRVVTVLVISCPHALGLAIPLTTAISSSQAARNGILIKDRLALERSRKLDAVLFDKTGTLTKGQHVVVGVRGRADRRRAPAACRRGGGRERAPACASHPRRCSGARRHCPSDRLPFVARSWRAGHARPGDLQGGRAGAATRGRCERAGVDHRRGRRLEAARLLRALPRTRRRDPRCGCRRRRSPSRGAPGRRRPARRRAHCRDDHGRCPAGRQRRRRRPRRR
jgi:P-type Cu2+ transporter